MSEPTWTEQLDAHVAANPSMAGFLGALRGATLRMDAAGQDGVPVFEAAPPVEYRPPVDWSNAADLGTWWRTCPHCRHFAVSAVGPPPLSSHMCRRGDRVVEAVWR